MAHFVFFRTILLALAFLLTGPLGSIAQPPGGNNVCDLHGVVYVEEVQGFADYKVFIEDTEAFADMNVFVESSPSFADAPGNWCFTETRSFAHFSIFITDVKAFADFSIFYSDFKSLAGCRR